MLLEKPKKVSSSFETAHNFPPAQFFSRRTAAFSEAMIWDYYHTNMDEESYQNQTHPIEATPTEKLGYKNSHLDFNTLETCSNVILQHSLLY